MLEDKLIKYRKIQTVTGMFLNLKIIYEVNGLKNVFKRILFSENVQTKYRAKKGTMLKFIK